MDDPNVVYKRDYQTLRETLGRHPTANELLPLHDAYKRAWAPAEETVFAPRAAAGRPAPTGFSRKPAPQARAIGSDTRAREVGEAEDEPLSGPRIIPEAEQAKSALPPLSAPPSNCDGPAEGDRGPGGGLVGKCVACGRLWERPTRKGRPSYRCGECR